jgi:hypothetical protein
MPLARETGFPTNVLHQQTFTILETLPAGTAISFDLQVADEGDVPVLGVLENDSIAGKPASVILGGVCQMTAAEPISRGSAIVPSGSGQARLFQLNASENIFGRALTTAAAEQKIQILITREGVS